MLITGLVTSMRWPESVRSTFPPLHFSRYHGNSLDGFLKSVRDSGKEREHILQPQSYNKNSIKKKKKKVIKAVILLHLVI